MSNDENVLALWKAVKEITDQQGKILNNVADLIEVIKKLTARVEYLERIADDESPRV